MKSGNFLSTFWGDFGLIAQKPWRKREKSLEKKFKRFQADGAPKLQISVPVVEPALIAILIPVCKNKKGQDGVI